VSRSTDGLMVASRVYRELADESVPMPVAMRTAMAQGGADPQAVAFGGWAIGAAALDGLAQVSGLPVNVVLDRLVLAVMTADDDADPT
jgi:hypothetical protein